MPKYRYIPIAGGGETPVLETLNATQNGQYFPGEGVTGWNEANINVPASEVDTGTKQTSITTNGTQTVDVVGYANHEVAVNVPASEVDSGTKQVSKTQNGTTTENVVGYADVEIDVDVQPNLQSKTVTQNGLVEPDQDYDGLSDVDVQVPASAVDSGTKQTSITTNGTQTVDVVGYANHEVAVNVPASEVDSGTKQVSKTQNGTTTENVVGYANIEIDVQVPAPYWSGTQAQYDALPSYSNDMLYLIIN